MGKLDVAYHDDQSLVQSLHIFNLFAHCSSEDLVYWHCENATGRLALSRQRANSFETNRQQLIPTIYLLLCWKQTQLVLQTPQNVHRRILGIIFWIVLSEPTLLHLEEMECKYYGPQFMSEQMRVPITCYLL